MARTQDDLRDQFIQKILDLATSTGRRISWQDAQNSYFSLSNRQRRDARAMLNASRLSDADFLTLISEHLPEPEE